MAGSALAIARASTSASAAALTVFTGHVQLIRDHGAATAGHTGDQLAPGTTVVTAADSRAAIVFPDGSATRLDSDTRVTVTGMTAVGGGLDTVVFQSAGQTWNRVGRLTGQARFRVEGPNSSTAEVRGTEFSVIVPADGSPVVFAVWQGAVDVSTPAGRVSLGSDQQTTVARGAAPTRAERIPESRARDPWTVFNSGLNQASGRVLAVYSGTASTGDEQGPYPAESPSPGDLTFTISWPGSRFEILVRDPAGTLVAHNDSVTPPLSVAVPGARPGAWSVTVRDLESSPREPWSVIVSRSDSHRPAGHESGPAAAAATDATSRRAPANPTPTKSREASAADGAATGPSTPAPDKTPAKTPDATATPTPRPEPRPSPTEPPSTPPPTPTPAPPPPPPPAALTITASAAAIQPGWKLGVPHSVQLTATGGAAPYSWSVAGALPPGVTVKNGSVGPLDGTPTRAGVYAFTVVVTDASGARATLPVVIVVAP